METFLSQVEASIAQEEVKAAEKILNEAKRYQEGKNIPLIQQARLNMLGSSLYYKKFNYTTSRSFSYKLIGQLSAFTKQDSIDLAVTSIWLQLGKTYTKLGVIDSGLICFQIAREVAQKLPAQKPDFFDSDIEKEIGILYYEDRDYSKAMPHLKTAQKKLMSNLPIDTTRLSIIYEAMSNVYFRKRDLEKSIEYSEKVLTLREKQASQNHTRLIIAFINHGMSYERIGNYEKAERYFEKAAQMSFQSNNSIRKDIPYHIQYNQSIVHLRTNELHEALTFGKEAVNLAYTVFGKTNRRTIAAIVQLGEVYKALEMYDEAILCFEEGIANLAQTPGENILANATCHFQLGKVHYRVPAYEQALKHFHIADSLVSTSSRDFSAFQADMYKMEALIYRDLANCQMANKSFRKAVAKRTGKEHYTIEELSEGESGFLKGTYSILVRYGDHLHNCYGENKDSLFWAKKVLDEAEEIMVRLRTINKEINDLSTLYKEGSFLESLYWDNLFLDYPTDTPPSQRIQEIFLLSEKNKAVGLLRALKNQNAGAFGNIPEDLLKLERELKVEVAYLEKSIDNELKNEETDTIKLQAYRAELFQFQQKSDSIEKIFAQRYPAYYNLKYDETVVTISKLQEVIPDDIGIIRYVLGSSYSYQDQNNYALVILADQYFAIPLPYFEKELIKQFHAGLMGSFLKNDSLVKPEIYYDSLYRKSAFTIYDHLLGPIVSKLGNDLPHRLIIIPEGEFNYIPFSVLLTDSVPQASLPKEYPYLLKKHAISSAFSATSYWRQVTDQRNSNNGKMLAFAPVYNGADFDEAEVFAARLRSELSPLKHNQQETKHINQLMRGSLYAGEDATLARFIELAPSHEIIHIASHAMLNETDHRFSYIAFSPNTKGESPSLLYLADLYGLTLNAELVVLSACNTARGELLSGEGVISLGQGFAYAGARSLVTTLWAVDDKATAQLMAYFYEGLAANLPKDIALQQAKLRLLEEENVAPFYWGAPIAIGDMKPLRSSKTRYWGIGIGFLIMLAIGFIYRKRWKN